MSNTTAACAATATARAGWCAADLAEALRKIAYMPFDVMVEAHEDLRDCKVIAADALAAFDRAVSGQTAEPCERCDGSAECKARTHVHGCFADRGDCDDPFEHASNRGQTAEKEEA